MICVALIEGLTLDVGVVEKPDRAHLVAYHHDWFAKELLDLNDLIVLIVLVPHTFEPGVGSEAIT